MLLCLESKGKCKKIDLVFQGPKPTPNNFKPIRNLKGYSKPDGGLWTSPMTEDGISAWQAYCEKVSMGYSKQRWHIVLKPDCKILVVEKNLSNIFPYLVESNLANLRYVIDFEKLSKDFDMIYVPEEVDLQGDPVLKQLFEDVEGKNGQAAQIKAMTLLRKTMQNY